jgi:hypothetical protein
MNELRIAKTRNLQQVEDYKSQKRLQWDKEKQTPLPPVKMPDDNTKSKNTNSSSCVEKKCVLM